MVIALFYMVLAKRSGTVRKFDYPVDNDDVETIRAQVRDAIKV